MWGSSFVIVPSAGSASLAGSLLERASELGIQSRASTLQLQLLADSWEVDQIGDTALSAEASQSILASVYATTSQPYGWNQIMRPLLFGGTVRRIKRTLVELTIPGSTEYSIAEPETLEVRLPGIAVQSRGSVAFASQVLIFASPNRPSLSVHSPASTEQRGLREAEVRQGGYSLLIGLGGDEWLPAVTTAGL